MSWHLPNFIWMQAHKCQIKLECLGFNILMPRTAITSIEKALPLTGPSIWVNIFCILTSKVETKWQGARKLTWIFQCLSPGPVSLRNNWFEYHIGSKLINRKPSNIMICCWEEVIWFFNSQAQNQDTSGFLFLRGLSREKRNIFDKLTFAFRTLAFSFHLNLGPMKRC